MELLLEEPPCKIDNVISYSFENLHKFLNFLVLNDKESFSKLNDVQLKLAEMDNLKRNLDDVTIRIFKSEEKQKEFEYSINSFFQKFSDLDTKIVSALHVLSLFLIFFIRVFFNFFFIPRKFQVLFLHQSCLFNDKIKDFSNIKFLIYK